MRCLVPREGRAAEGRCLTATSAAALSMITKEKHAHSVLFFRDHEFSGLRPPGAPSPAGRPGGPGKDLSTSNPVVHTVLPAASMIEDLAASVRLLG
jgi:hypothetical protein